MHMRFVAWKHFYEVPVPRPSARVDVLLIRRLMRNAGTSCTAIILRSWLRCVELIVKGGLSHPSPSVLTLIVKGDLPRPSPSVPEADCEGRLASSESLSFD